MNNARGPLEHARSARRVGQAERREPQAQRPASSVTGEAVTRSADSGRNPGNSVAETDSGA